MNEELRLAIGGIGILIKWQDSQILNWPHPLYETFVSGIEPRITLDVHCTELPRHSSRLLFDGKRQASWRLYRNYPEYIIETFDTLTRKKNRVCFMKADFSHGRVYVDPQSERLHSLKKLRSKSPFWSLPRLMEPLGKLLLVNVLADEGGIMAHGFGLNDRGSGIVFLGRSGAGKSTMADFWRDQEGADILSDEHIIIRKKNGQFRLCGTPWPGMAAESSSKCVPLHQIFFIEHAAENKILGPANSSDLFPLLFLPFWGKERLDSILKICEDIFRALNWKKLGFLKDESVIKFVRKECDRRSQVQSKQKH